MNRNLIRNLSVNTLQLVLNQLSGLVIFYILSTSLDKNNFGQVNLALAILLAAFNILSLGIDQLIIKRIASGTSVSSALSLYIWHVLIAGIAFYGMLLLGRVLFQQTETYNLILFIGAGKLMIFFSTPFKQIANGMERFKLLAYMSVISNLLRCLILLILVSLHQVSLHTIIVVFVVSDLAELLIGICLFKSVLKVRLFIKWRKENYIKLLREALPQAGVAVITSALARFDWIFIGFIVSAVKLAEYSFAYKVFEIATLPLLAIAPLLIPLFTRLFQRQDIQAANLKFLIRAELIIAAFVALLLNICWSPVVDTITSGKYGQVNVKTIFILSLSMPLLYVNNFLWTIHFSKGRLKMILNSFIITLLVNIAGDALLIPLYKNEGAAFAFLLACLAQTMFYMKKNDISGLKIIWRVLISCIGCALGSGILTSVLFQSTWAALPFSAIFYVFLLFITRQIQPNDRKRFRDLFRP